MPTIEIIFFDYKNYVGEKEHIVLLDSRKNRLVGDFSVEDKYGDCIEFLCGYHRLEILESVFLNIRRELV